jgi:hypothetical protein
MPSAGAARFLADGIRAAYHPAPIPVRRASLARGPHPPVRLPPMTISRLRFGVRLRAAALAACCLLGAAPAFAQGADARGLSGVWRGTYVCGQGRTALELEMRGNRHGIVRAVFRFSAAAENPGVPTGQYAMLGRLTGASLVLRPAGGAELPRDYIPVGIQGSVAADGRRMDGWIEGATCRAVSVRKVADAAPGAPLAGGYPQQRWEPFLRAGDVALDLDARPRPRVDGSTARIWVRWRWLADSDGVQAGAARDVELEYDCAAGLERTWTTVAHAADGQITDFDASAPFRWYPVDGPGTASHGIYEQACSAGRTAERG